MVEVCEQLLQPRSAPDFVKDCYKHYALVAKAQKILKT